MSANRNIHGGYTGLSDTAHASPQFWESGPALRENRNRIYFTAEGDGRVIAGASPLGYILSPEEAVSLAAWLLRMTDVEHAARLKADPLDDPETMDAVMRSAGLE